MNNFLFNGILNLQVYILSICISIFMFCFILMKIKNGKLHIKDSLIWLFICIIILCISIFPKLFFTFTKLLGIGMPISALFFFAIIFLLLIVFNLTLKISILSEENKKLTQEIALLKNKIENIININILKK